MPPAAPFIIAAAVLLFIVLIWTLTTYNGLVRLRQYVAESWSTIDTELKRRHDLIPNLVEVCRGYAAHEQTVFEQVARARGEAAAATDPAVPPVDQARRESALTGSLRTLFAVSEGYPELKASDHFLALQRELAVTEDRIQAARVSSTPTSATSTSASSRCPPTWSPACFILSEPTTSKSTKPRCGPHRP